LKPDAVVLVATIRAIKHHAGLAQKILKLKILLQLKKDFATLEKHIENIQNLD
jgi:formate--tetrahydrofolate ligase